MAVKTPSAVTL